MDPMLLLFRRSSMDFINQMFPAEASLIGVEPLMQKIHNQIRFIDAEILAAVRQQVMASKRQYKEAASQLEAVNELCNHFEGYWDVPKITELREKLKHIKQILSLGNGTETEDKNLLKTLSDACWVVESLEPSVREEVVNNFCSRELTSYEHIYVGAELTNLDEIERVYSQLYFRIRTNQEKWKIFPTSWHVPNRLCIQLCKKTREQVESILVNMKEKPNVERLLLELKRTLKFEKELEMKFGGGVPTKHLEYDIEEIGEGEKHSQNVSEIRMKYEKKFSANQELGADDKIGNKCLSDAGAGFNFLGIISSSFEPHLTPYVEAEEKELMQLLEKVVQEETWDIKEETQNNILSSSIQVFQRVLKAYATKILLMLPKGGTGIVSAATGMGGQIKVSEREERVICYIINSAEYCHKTSCDLAEEVSTIIDLHYVDGVDMSEEEFSSVITKALVTLVRGLETKFDSKMEKMTRLPWATLKSVGDQSKYVNKISKILSNSIPVLGNLLTPVYFQFLLDKVFEFLYDLLALSFGPKFYANIFRCQQISEIGAQQMLLDTHAMRMILLKLPSLAGQTTNAASYFEFVNREMSRAEAVLKVIPSPIVSVADTYLALFPKGTPVEFQRILELKGLTKAEQRSILDSFNNHGIGSTQPSVAVAMPQPPAPPHAISNPSAGVGFIANGEDVLTRGAATTTFRKFFALTEAAKDRPFRNFFNA